MILSKVYTEDIEGIKKFFCSKFKVEKKSNDIITKEIIQNTTKQFNTKKDCEYEYTRQTWLKHNTSGLGLGRRQSKRTLEKRWYKF